MLEFEFLGTNGSVADIDGANTSLIVRAGDRKFLVDVSSSVSRALDVDCVILTHSHIDHVFALPSLIHQMWLTGRKEKLTVYAMGKTLKIANEMVELFNLRAKKGIFDIEICEIGFDSVMQGKAIALKNDHTEDSFSLLFEEGGKKLYYTSDTRPLSLTDVRVENSDVLVTEASGLSKNEEVLIRKGHSSGLDSGTLAKKIGAGNLYLCHLPSGDEKEQILLEAKSVFKKAEIPELHKKYRI
jgi:Metal-dependent hydrolases of the beta-lactamase superfamily III